MTLASHSTFLRRTAALALVALSAGAALAGCGTASHASQGSGPWAGGAANPPYIAPTTTLTNYDGRRVDLAGYRGKAVLLTFIYDHCPDTCPLIVGHLHSAQAQLGSDASKVQIIAISVDPRGDTPQTVQSFLRAHQMLGRMDYLVGSRKQLQPVWKRWGILAKADPANPAAVGHSALIYGISASGMVTTLYPANFTPGMIVHDVPRLAAR